MLSATAFRSVKKKEETTHLHASGYRSNRILQNHESEQTPSLPSYMYESQDCVLNQEIYRNKVLVISPNGQTWKGPEWW